MFSSGKHEKCTADPFPVVNPLMGRRFSFRTKKAMMSCEFIEGRPEFDRSLTNPKSWALHDARQYRATRSERRGAPVRWDDVRRVFEQAVGAAFYSDYEDHDEMVTHARAVLTRLARLEQAAELGELERAEAADTYRPLPIHRTEAGYPNCSTCDGGGCHDCTDPA
ncbi:hypothetical protein [Agromyces sp. NPDC058104]|uniref:hypothetical protein n=1 Tax=Agromyces sp. NPDC058104 TaxID=3346342 RepID=UPI0036DCC702